jgi:hypothetical protein
MDKKFVERLLPRITQLNDLAFRKLHDELEKRPQIRATLNPAFPFPKEIRFGLLPNFLVVEYLGPEQPEDDYFKVTAAFYDNMLNFLDMDLSHLEYKPIPMQSIPGLEIFDEIENRVEDISFFLGDSINILCDYSYRFFYDTESALFEGIFDFETAQNPFYVSNSTFFWTDNYGNLKVRRIDFMEVWPLENGHWIYPTRPEKLADLILACPVPAFDVKLHKTLNEFIEMVGDSSRHETHITKFIEENPEILQLGIGVRELNPQRFLEWQYPCNKPNLKPDFMPARLNGYVDLLDFKLPKLKSKPIVGSSTRSHPSFEVDSALAQLDEYEEWCSQEIHQNWLFETQKIKVKSPDKYLIIGHSRDFTAEERERLRKTRDAIIWTYDEFIDMVRFQLYRVKNY